MKEFRADLHCHSTCSDGTESPEQLLQKAVDIGLTGFSITDHDSIDAYHVVMPLAKKHGLEMISGAEFSSIQDNVSVHILAYSFPLDSPIIQEFCKKHNIRRENRNRDILKRLKANKMIVTEEEIAASTPLNLPLSRRTIGRPHIAQVMVEKGYVKSVADAFKKYLGEGKSCYAPGESFTAQETLDVIHKANGIAVIAHPHLLHSPSTLKKLLKMNFDGIECYYARSTLLQCKRWLEIAEKKGWLITGGSDFHGTIKPDIQLGCSWVNEETFRVLQKHFENNSQG